MQKNKWNYPKLICILIIIIAFTSTTATVLSVPKPTGSDYYWHLNIATMIANGNPTQAINYLLSSDGNSFPYGFYISIFHLALVPTVWSGNPYLIAQILQILFLPCTLAATVWLVYKYHSPKAAVYTGMTLFASWAFMDGAIQVRPESLDLLLYPLIVAALMATQKKRFIGYTVITIYGHGLAALSNIYGLAVKRFKEKTWTKTFAITFLLILPVLIVSALYIQGAFTKWGGAGLTENPQEVKFWKEPLTFIPYYMGATIIGVPFLFKKNKTEFQKLILWGLIGNLIMLPLWADRWLHYISLPLAIFAGIGITGLKGKWKLAAVMALLDIFIVYTASYFGFSFGLLGHWWQPGN